MIFLKQVITEGKRILITITKEGERYLAEFPEEQLLKALSKSGSLNTSKISNSIGIGWAKKNGWIHIRDNKITLTETGLAKAKDRSYVPRDVLNLLSDSKESGIAEIYHKNRALIEELAKRNLVIIKEAAMIGAPKVSVSAPATNTNEIAQLTREIIMSKSWTTKRFRPYDINAPTEPVYPAREHPLHEFIDKVRNIWLQMGFTEVSGPIIEPAFWVFDVLFSPQDHPTREMQDTFFLKNPSKISVEDMALMNRVKKMHQKAWKERWKEEIAQQAVLRTHTTSVSARSISKYANLDEQNYPLKIFTVGRNFRNESIDYKHLAEFYMFEGIIIGNNLTLSNLIYELKQFYSYLGMENLVFRPAYFPFVEPGLEICYYDEKKKDTIELGGAGIIRKEITKAMGTNKTVLAWGPGLERLMFKAFGIDTLAELYKNDIGWLRKREALRP